MAKITKAERARMAENQRRSRARRAARAKVVRDAGPEEFAVAEAAIQQMVQDSLVSALVPALMQALPPALAASREVRPAPKPDESPATASKVVGDQKITPSLTEHLLESVSGMAGVLSRLRALAGRASHGDESPERAAAPPVPAPTTHIDLAATVRQQTNIAHDILDVIERSV